MAKKPLTDLAARTAKPAAKPYKLAAGAGMYLEVMPNGSKYWRLKYRIAGKEKRLALGVYPETTMKKAQDDRDKARIAIREGRDPSAERRTERVRKVVAAENTFEAITRAWLALQRKKLAPSTFDKATWTFETLAFPWLGRLAITEIEPTHVLGVLKKVEARGRHETAHRLKQRIAQVFRYAIALGIVRMNPATELRDALAPIVSTRRAAITDPTEIGRLLRDIDAYEGGFVVASALRLAPLVFVRPGELRRAEWTEIDIERAEWRIPAEKMKMRDEHVVPLSSQAVRIIEDLRPLTGRGLFLFPSVRTLRQPISNNTINAALRRLGYDKATMTGHGFRALASTRLNELGWSPDVIERQLAHVERNRVRAAYNRAAYLAERRKMMQAWADYLDSLRIGADVIPIRRKA
jgi:integrase